jgi:hypothetical protein
MNKDPEIRSVMLSDSEASLRLYKRPFAIAQGIMAKGGETHD